MSKYQRAATVEADGQTATEFTLQKQQQIDSEVKGVLKDFANRKSLTTKLAEVMGAVSHVEKKGKNDHDNYKYMKAVDLLAAVRPELAKRNVILLTSAAEMTESSDYTSAKGTTMHFIRAKFLFSFIDGDSGERLEFSGWGDASDRSDKAIYKAMTGALKYAIRNTFLVPDENDDPEVESNQRESKSFKREKRQDERAEEGKQVKTFQGKVIECKEPVTGKPGWFKLHNENNSFLSFDSKHFELAKVENAHISVVAAQEWSASQKPYWKVVSVSAALEDGLTASLITARMVKDAKVRKEIHDWLGRQVPETGWLRVCQNLEKRVKADGEPKSSTGWVSLLEISHQAVVEEMQAENEAVGEEVF